MNCGSALISFLIEYNQAVERKKGEGESASCAAILVIIFYARFLFVESFGSVACASRTIPTTYARNYQY